MQSSDDPRHRSQDTEHTDWKVASLELHGRLVDEQRLHAKYNDVLYRLAKDNAGLLANLHSVQERCNELLEETRSLRALLAKTVCVDTEATPKEEA